MLGAQYEMPELTSWGFPAFDLGMDDEEEPDTLTAGKSDKKPTIKVSFENVTDLESIKPLIEEAIKPYVDIGTKITISVSAGEL